MSRRSTVGRSTTQLVEYVLQSIAQPRISRKPTGVELPPLKLSIPVEEGGRRFARAFLPLRIGRG